MEGEGPIPDHTHLLDTGDGAGSEEGEGLGEGEGLEEEEELIDGDGTLSLGRISGASDDSFHSTVEVFDMETGDNRFYQSAREIVAMGGVQCRKVRYASSIPSLPSVNYGVCTI